MAKFIFEWGWWTLNVGEDGGMGYVSNAYMRRNVDLEP